MLYLGIDQHARQITVSLRADSGDVLPARQVSTQPEKFHAFFQQLTRERLPTKAAIAWLQEVALPEIDRPEMNHLLADLGRAQQRLKELEGVIAQRCGVSKEAALLATMPGVRHFTATSLACRVGRVERFPRAHSLASYWGLTPGCRNSGENNRRLGSITKAGGGMARRLPAQVTHKVLRKDTRSRGWFKRIKRRRGATIARVAVMRKLATIIWHMLSKRTSYAACRALAAA
jgi:transposase